MQEVLCKDETFSKAKDISFPIDLSPFADIVATCAISSGVVTGLDCSFNAFFTASTASITPKKKEKDI